MALPNHCPLCLTKSDQIRVKTKHVFGDFTGSSAFFECEICHVVFQYPGLSEQEEKEFYESEFEEFMTLRSGNSGGWEAATTHQKANESTVTRRMKYLTPLLNSDPLKILEIGCSSGFMLSEFRRMGHLCTGIEPSGFFSKFLKNDGYKIVENIDEARELEVDGFDIICHFFVLEHVKDPLAFLQTQLELLADNGKLVFEIPNKADPLSEVFDVPEFERFYWSKAHPWYFGEKSVSFLLDKLGCKYKILLDQRYDLSNHLSWAMSRRPGGQGKYADNLGKELDDFYKSYLVKRRMCDTLIAVLEN